MDKNTVVGFILIAAIIIGFAWINKPSAEEIERRQRYNDSVSLVMQQELEKQLELDSIKAVIADKNSDNEEVGDSAFLAMRMDAFGGFGVSSFGQEEFFTIENDLVEITLSSKGGRVYSVNLKEYKAQDDEPLILFDNDESNFNLVFITNNNRVINTSDLFLQNIGDVVVDADGNSQMTMRINTEVEGSYIDFVYTLMKDDYMLKFDIVSSRMNEVIPLSLNSLDLQWNSLIRQQEKGRKFEEQLSTLSYKFLADNVEKLNANKNDSKDIANQLKWIAFKDQYFSSVLIADEAFASARLSSVKKDDTKYIKEYTAQLVIPYDPMGNKSTGFTYYFGPNHYKTLSAYDKGKSGIEDLRLRELVPLGWGILGWVNRFFVIPIFNFFSNFIGSFGIIILLLTIVIKLVLFPLSYKSYMSSAKMRVLKPEIDAINERIPADKAMERQQATMALYNKMGVSPMSGCLPMLLQMPILIALFRFFPGAIELRQESFLWVKDLSAYDAILTWKANIPLISSVLDNHVSLFAVLMTVTSIFSTRISMATTQPAADQPGAGMMKSMMYIMPIMFFFLFNSYASGLTYYYTLSSLFTVIQNGIIKATINEDKLLAELQAKAKENGKKNAKKGGGFMARLEQMQREQQKMVRENAKNRKR